MQDIKPLGQDSFCLSKLSGWQTRSPLNFSQFHSLSPKSSAGRSKENTIISSRSEPVLSPFDSTSNPTTTIHLHHHFGPRYWLLLNRCHSFPMGPMALLLPHLQPTLPMAARRPWKYTLLPMSSHCTLNTGHVPISRGASPPFSSSLTMLQIHWPVCFTFSNDTMNCCYSSLTGNFLPPSHSASTFLSLRFQPQRSLPGDPQWSNTRSFSLSAPCLFSYCNMPLFRMFIWSRAYLSHRETVSMGQGL